VQGGVLFVVLRDSLKVRDLLRGVGIDAIGMVGGSTKNGWSRKGGAAWGLRSSRRPRDTVMHVRNGSTTLVMVGQQHKGEVVRGRSSVGQCGPRVVVM
jgi:hypothetical protein